MKWYDSIPILISIISLPIGAYLVYRYAKKSKKMEIVKTACELIRDDALDEYYRIKEAYEYAAETNENKSNLGLKIKTMKIIDAGSFYSTKLITDAERRLFESGDSVSWIHKKMIIRAVRRFVLAEKMLYEKSPVGISNINKDLKPIEKWLQKIKRYY